MGKFKAGKAAALGLKNSAKAKGSTKAFGAKLSAKRGAAAAKGKAKSATARKLGPQTQKQASRSAKVSAAKAKVSGAAASVRSSRAAGAAGGAAAAAGSAGRKAAGNAQMKSAFAASKGKKALRGPATRAKGSGPIAGAGPSKERMAGGAKGGVSKTTYGSGRKRNTVVNARAGSKQVGVNITPGKRTAAYGTSAVGAGGYTTYKRRTKSGKVVTVRRKKG